MKLRYMICLISLISLLQACTEDSSVLITSEYVQGKPTCGNGMLDSDEICDKHLISDHASCPPGMSLPEQAHFKCSDTCTLDTSACIPNIVLTPQEPNVPQEPEPQEPEPQEPEPQEPEPQEPEPQEPEPQEPDISCGNGVLDNGEICDGSLFADDARCPDGTTLLSGRSITCTSNCTLNTENCKPPCGNGELNTGEICDGSLFADDARCPDGTTLLNGRSITCTSNCTLNIENCKPPCGNGELNNDEICDGSLFADHAKCPDGTSLPSGKKLGCKTNCTLDTSMCVEPCKTRIEYGSEWIHGPNHPSNVDNANGKVTWDGTCINDGSNSYAVLSNGWKPYFEGNDRCLISLDYTGDCPDIDNICRTRVTYSQNWKPGPGHENQYYDEVKGVITWNGVCYTDHAILSNGWAPYYNGTCGISIRYTQCGPLFTNPVIAADTPDPGAILDNDTYYIVHTGGNTSGAYRIHSSTDLVNWKTLDYAFPNGSVPSWAESHFWAPEIHKVGTKYNIYFSAKNRNTGQYSVGVGVSEKPQGPYKDIGKPLVSKLNMGVIDASYFMDTDGKHYVIWKDDGNAVGKKTPVYIQQLDAAGTALVGNPTEILTNTLSWEGALVEGPWIIKKGKYYYLFYSGNGYSSPSYALGVARATQVHGPYTKHGDPIIKTQGYFQGPGHGSVIQTKSGEWIHIYHSWIQGKVAAYPPGRVLLVDRIYWKDDWPMSYSAPLRRSQPYIR